jgi:hypothetical protein
MAPTGGAAAAPRAPLRLPLLRLGHRPRALLRRAPGGVQRTPVRARASAAGDSPLRERAVTPPRVVGVSPPRERPQTVTGLLAQSRVTLTRRVATLGGVAASLLATTRGAASAATATVRLAGPKRLPNGAAFPHFIRAARIPLSALFAAAAAAAATRARIALPLTRSHTAPPRCHRHATRRARTPPRRKRRCAPPSCAAAASHSTRAPTTPSTSSSRSCASATAARASA